MCNGLLIYRPPVLSASRCISESRRCISISRWKVSTYMYVYKTVSPIVVYILQNIQTCPKVFTQMTEEYENNYEDDYVGAITSHSYFLDYLPVPEMSTNIQGETLIEDLEYMPSCSHDHENQVGQSK